MQHSLTFLLLIPLTLFILIFCRRRHAWAREAAYARLAAVKSAVVKKLPGLGRQPPEVFVTDRFTAHRLLVGGAAAGGAFSDRPPSTVPSAVLSRRRHYNINSAPYGPLWRAIRRNLTSEVFHPTRLRQHGRARRLALHGLVADLDQQRRASGSAVLAAESLRAAMFGLLATMCFGAGVDEGVVRAMADAQDDLVQCFLGLRVFATLPALTGLIYRDRWRKLLQLRRQQEEAYLPLIEAHRAGRQRRNGEPPAYVDTLVDLRVPADEDAAASGSGGGKRRKRQRRLTDGELVGLCSEFLGAGTEPAAALLQWIMANLVKRPDVQRALRQEIDAAVGVDADEVGEEVVARLEYLNAVIMEGLRLHPTVPRVFRKVGINTINPKFLDNQTSLLLIITHASL